MTNEEIPMDNCDLCNRYEISSIHHLIPVTLHRKKLFIKKFGKKEMKERKASLCLDCHKHIHTIYDEKYLGLYLNTVELLRNDPKLQKFIVFIRKQH